MVDASFGIDCGPGVPRVLDIHVIQCDFIKEFSNAKYTASQNQDGFIAADESTFELCCSAVFGDSSFLESR